MKIHKKNALPLSSESSKEKKKVPPPIAAKRSIRRGILLLTGDVWRRRQDADISSEITQKKIKIDSEVTLYLFHCMDAVRTHHF